MRIFRLLYPELCMIGPGNAGVSPAHFLALQSLPANIHASSRSSLVDLEIRQHSHL